MMVLQVMNGAAMLARARAAPALIAGMG